MQKVSEIKIELGKFPKVIIDTLKKASYEAYIVGGCVRDALLGESPSDYDITTSADPNMIKKLFKRTIDTGIKHGTVTVLFYENDVPYTYEVTTFRKDGDYEDMRHPKDVRFVTDLSEDLLRRDFTINAMAYNEEKGLVDFFGGLVDLEKGIIRAVGNPTERFTEDALRLLRAVRFAAKLGFKIDDDTRDAIPPLSKNLSYVSKERVQVELTKTIVSDHPDYVKLVFDLSLAKYICSGFDRIKIGKFEKRLPIHLAYACLFYNTNASDTMRMLRELKLDNNTINSTTILIDSKKYMEKFNEFFKTDKTEFECTFKWLINEIGYELTYDFIKLIEINGKPLYLTYMKELINKYESERTPIFVGDLMIDGNDLMTLKLKGQEIGLALYYLLKIVHKNKAYNEKKLLKEIVEKAYNMTRGETHGLY